MARLESPSAALDQIVDRVRGARRKKQLSAVGAAVFAGGFSFGAEEAGFRVAGHLELTDCELGSKIAAARWPVVLSPFDRNDGPPSRLHPRDLTTWMSASELMRLQDAVPDLVIMNPPCSAFAKQGKRRGMDDEVMCHTIRCVKLGMALQPTVWAWELVEGVWDDLKGKAWITERAKEAEDHGYRTYVWLTSSSLHGGYQNRVRFHFVASRVPLDFESVYADEPEWRKGWRKLGTALEHLNDARNGGKLRNDEDVGRSALHALMPFLPPGGYLRELNDHVMREHYRPRGREWDGKSRAGATHVRARLDRYCPVVVGGQSIVHPEEHRWITPREAATVMGFPFDYEFSSGGKAYQEVGKGLCTHNAAFLCRVVSAGIQAASKTRRKGKLDGALHESTDLAVLDWRDRVDVPVLSAKPEDKVAWFRAQHPDLPEEWALPRKKGTPGRKAGTGGTMAKVGDRSVLLVGASQEAVDACRRVGLEVVEYGTESASDAEFAKVAALMRTVRAAAWWSGSGGFEGAYQDMARGAAIALGVGVVLPKTDPLATAMSCARAVGMTDADVSAAILSGQDPMALLRASMGQPSQDSEAAK